MLISQLPENIRIIAEQRRAEKPYHGDTEDDLNWAFIWSETPEGHRY